MTNAPQDPNSGTEDRNTAGNTAGDQNAAEKSETLAQAQTPADSDSTAPQNSAPDDSDRTSETAPIAGAPVVSSAAETAASSPTQPYDRAYTGVPAAPLSAPTDAKRSKRVVMVAAFAVAALVGGVSGAGVTALAFSANQGSNSASSTSNTAPQNITVNDTTSVNNITAVAAKAAPSVVTISVASKNASGTGSGVILSTDGYILTNTHVVTLDGEIADPAVQVTTSDGRLFSATVVGTDPIADLAVIKLKDPSNLTPAEFADSSKLNVGATAIAIGAPLGLNNTVTNGIVSALNRSISIASSAAPSSGDSSTPKSGSPFDFWKFDNGQGGSQGQPTTAAASISLPVIQTDAAINPGNSGGALLDSNAKVIGINVAIASAGQTSAASQSGSIGVGFAIPANLAQRVANEIIKNGKATHGLLGASVQDASATSSSAVVGASIKEVTSGGAADKAGVRSGDVVTGLNGVPITSSTDLTAQVRFLPAGASTTLTYVRGGKASTVDVTLGTLKQ
ncbi:S1C family serine protease [Frigoribacterium sp. CG_9.8]|uniref:S1C family serine protease n=1 Tax=Frigoribacterium sp. CG_9.8 TaxID=2787733 RepID=UPI0018CA6909|nr:trypsin-like peptidase domain-containing protein [Frigoribacterium sp. CG_9.8]MBG6107539.1 putative serine protease PepD [Frigoribacterium sp. CG_9.8]